MQELASRVFLLHVLQSLWDTDMVTMTFHGFMVERCIEFCYRYTFDRTTLNVKIVRDYFHKLHNEITVKAILLLL